MRSNTAPNANRDGSAADRARGRPERGRLRPWTSAWSSPRPRSATTGAPCAPSGRPRRRPRLHPLGGLRPRARWRHRRARRPRRALHDPPPLPRAARPCSPTSPAARRTSAFATSILIGPQRQTALLAKQAAELDLLCDGRFRLGLGIGWNKVEYDALGMPFGQRAAILEEQVAVLRALWTHRERDDRGALPPHHGGRPRPAAGAAPDSHLDRRLRAGRAAPGRAAWPTAGSPTSGPAAGWNEALEIIREGAAEAGRDLSGFQFEGRLDYAGARPRQARRATRGAGARPGPATSPLITMHAGLDDDRRAHRGARGDGAGAAVLAGAAADLVAASAGASVPACQHDAMPDEHDEPASRRRTLAPTSRSAPSPGSGAASGAPGSAGRPPTSRCCAGSRRARGVARRGRVRGRHRGDQPPARSGVDAAGHLLRLAAARPARAHSVGGACFICPGLAAIIVLAAVFLAAQPARWITGAALGAGAAVAPVALNAALGLVPASWRRAGSGAGAAGALGRLRRGRRRGGGDPRHVPRARAARVRSGRGRRSSGGVRPPKSLNGFVAAPLGRRGHGWTGRAGLGGAQGGGAVVRRRVRHHPAHAGRRGAPLPLDDERPVPQRGGARADHAGAGRADGGGGRLRRGGRRRRAAGRPGRLRAVVRVHPGRGTPFRRAAGQPGGAVLPRRRGAGRHRRHRRRGHPPGAGHRARVAGA